MGKRGNGDGTIYRRKDGLWMAQITVAGQKRKTFYGKTRKEVQEKLQAAQAELRQGTLVTGPQQTVKEYLEYWLEYAHKRAIRPRSYERYEQIIRLHIVPSLGKLHLQKLTPQHLQKLYADKAKAGFSPVTVIAIHNMLHTALDDAIRLGLVSRNVCKLVSPPRRPHREMKALTPDQVRFFLSEARGHPQETLFILALATGMRRGELLGLKWQDINFAQETLQVRRVLSRVPTKMVDEVGQSYVEAEPKTEKSRRSIALAPFALEALKEQRSRQEEMKEKAGVLWEDHDYVFCTPTGKHLHPGNVLVQLKNVLKKAGLPDIRFHDLRHSTATMLLSMGVHPKVVLELLGHSEISMTMDIYSHVLPSIQRDAVNRLSNTLHGWQDGKKVEDGNAPP
jgi:integrase